MADSKKIVLLVVIVAICTWVALGFYDIAVWNQNKNKYSGGTSQECPVFPNITQMTEVKQYLSQWHWRYNFEYFSGSIQQVCPSITHDVNVYLGDRLVAASDGKYLSTSSTIYINDCTGSRIFTIQTGSFWVTLLNTNKILVSLQVLDALGTTLAYVQGQFLITDTITLYDLQQQQIARLTRNILSIPWKWDITQDQPHHPAADFRLLTILSGKRAFSDSDTSDKYSSDGANTFFWAIAWSYVAVAVILLLVGGVLLYMWCKGDISTKDCCPC